METREKFVLLESDITAQRFILLEGEEDEIEAEPSKEEDSEAADSQRILAKVAYVKGQLLKIASAAESKRAALADSVKPEDEPLADAAEKHEKVRIKAEEIEKALDAIEKRATDEANRFGALTIEELSMKDAKAAFEDGQEGMDDDLAGIFELFAHIEPNVNDERSLDAAKSVCANISLKIDAFSSQYTDTFENRQRRAIADKERDDEEMTRKSDNELKAAIASVVPNTEALPKGVEEIVNGDAFAQEIKTFGAKPSMNPFISFLKKAHDSNQAVWNKINAGYYAAIHNAYVDRQISKQELATGKCDALVGDNVISKADFYSKPYSEAGQYLDIQYEICEAIRYKQPIDHAEALKSELDIDRSENSSDGMLFDAEVGRAVLYESNGVLRPLTDVKRYVDAFVGSGYGKDGKILKTEPSAIEASLARTIGCEPAELKSHSEQLANAIRILTVQAYLRGVIKELNYDASEKALNAIGKSKTNIAIDGETKDADAAWIKLFNCENKDYKGLLDSYLKTISSIFKPASEKGEK